MNKYKEFLIEFEKYLEKKIWKFNKYELNNSFIYDIEETVIILINKKEEFSKDHIICRELLNLKDENDYKYLDIKIKPFCAKYIKEWVTFYPFDGEKVDELNYIDREISSLKLLERYENWKGYRVAIAGFELEDNGKKGYALVKMHSIGNIIELREIGKFLLNAYIKYVVENPNMIIENEKIIKAIDGFEFIINKNMVEILNERYIKKYSIDSLKKMREIVDLKGFWSSTFQKNIKEIPYDLFENLEGDKLKDALIIHDIYTESMKEKIPKIEDIDKEYYYISVVYADNLDSYNSYNYISDDESIKEKDKVLVNRAGDDVVALVTGAEHYLGCDVPFPVGKTKKVIKKIENDEELRKYGYEPENFKDYEYFYDEDEDDEGKDVYSYSYYVITTLCDRQEIVDKISKTLMEKRLVTGSQIYTVRSDYWWEGKIESKEEFKLEVKTRSDKIDEIVKEIKEIHDYQIPAIHKTGITCLTDEMKEWINKSVQ